jgi:hypothetical protein
MCQMNDLLINAAAIAAGAVAGLVWWRLGRSPSPAGSDAIEMTAAPNPASQEVAQRRSAASSERAMQAQTGPKKPVRSTEPTTPAAPVRDGGDFVTSALVAGATNSATIGYLVGGSLAGALLGDALQPDKTEAAPAEDVSRKSSDSGWTDTGTSCAFESSSTDSGGGSGGGD